MWRRIRTIFLLIALALILISTFIIYPRVATLWARLNPSYANVTTDLVSWPPNPSFQSCWADRRLRFRGAIYWPVLGSQRVDYCEAEGTYLPVNRDKLMVLLVLLPKGETPPGAPAMRLAISSLGDVSNSVDGRTAILPDGHAQPPIECDLDVTEADWVRANGVPQSLIDEMQRIAREAGWRPLEDNEIPVTPIKVDPKPHFPE